MKVEKNKLSNIVKIIRRNKILPGSEHSSPSSLESITQKPKLFLRLSLN